MGKGKIVYPSIKTVIAFSDKVFQNNIYIE